MPNPPDANQRTRIFKRNLEVLIARNQMDSESRFPTVCENSAADVEIKMASGAESLGVLRTDGQAWACDDSMAPRAKAEATIAEWPADEGGVFYFLVGFGFGYLAEAILAKMSGKSRLLVAEPFVSVFHSAMANRDLRKVFRDSRFDVIVGNDLEAIKSRMDRVLFQAPFHNIRAVIAPAYRQSGDLAFADMTRAATMRFRSRMVDLNTLRTRGFENCRRTVENMDWAGATTGLEALDGMSPIPGAVVVGAGPSLDGSLKFAKTMADRVPIIAVDASVPALRAAGVDPHLVVVIDGHDRCFESASTLNPATTGLVLDSQVSPRFRAQPSLFRLVALPPAWIQQLALAPMRKGWGEQMGFVGGAAVWVAGLLGARTTYLLGMDFAFGADGQVYAERAQGLSRAEESDSASGPFVRGYGAPRLPTTNNYLCHLERFETFARKHHERAFKVVCTDGAKIAELPRLSPEEAQSEVSLYPEMDWLGPLQGCVRAAEARTDKEGLRKRLEVLSKKFIWFHSAIKNCRGPKEAEKVLFAADQVPVFNLFSSAFQEVVEGLLWKKSLNSEGWEVLREGTEKLLPLIKKWS